MNTLFLFFTQAEGGAKNYLSRKGDDAAANLAETIAQFLVGTLSLDLSKGFDARVKSLDEDLQWRAFKQQASLRNAAEAALNLEPTILVVSGGDWRSLKTAEAVATQLALPVCVDEKVDGDFEKKQPGLKEALMVWEQWIATGVLSPKVVLVGTSLKNLTTWLEGKFEPEKFRNTKQILEESTQNDTIPAVFAAGTTGTNAHLEWIFD